MITIVEANSKKLLTYFVKFPFTLYRNHPYWVPPLINDELDTFDKKKIRYLRQLRPIFI